jgi:hypothetical protein
VSGIGLSLTEQRPNTADLLSATGGIVKGWLRNTTVGAVSSWTDVLNPGSPRHAGHGFAAAHRRLGLQHHARWLGR